MVDISVTELMHILTIETISRRRFIDGKGVIWRTGYSGEKVGLLIRISRSSKH